jgi:hypothetical protein
MNGGHISPPVHQPFVPMGGPTSSPPLPPHNAEFYPMPMNHGYYPPMPLDRFVGNGGYPQNSPMAAPGYPTTTAFNQLMEQQLVHAMYNLNVDTPFCG